MKLLRSSTLLFVGILLFIAALSGCGNPPSAAKNQNIIATVNKEPILASELKQDLAIRTRQAPLAKVTPQMEAEQLNLIIDRKLIIQEAIHRGLARDEKFVNTIKTFWEQTLVREFLDHKKQEFAGQLSVTDQEIQQYYSNLGRRVTFMVLKSLDKAYIDGVYSQWKQLRQIDPSVWQIVGPVGYSEIDSDVLRQAFDAPVNEVKPAADAPNYYLVMVKDRQDVAPQPLEVLRPAIERDLVAMKEQRLLDEWLKTQRAQADIKVLRP